MRPSTNALAAVGRELQSARQPLLTEWAGWINKRLAAEHLHAGRIERQLGLLIDLLVELTGPWRREATTVWLSAAEWYGRSAAERGLAAGEVVEEFQHFRELLIHRLSDCVAALPDRQSMATFLRLNRMLDKAIAHAVVGYTDAMVESLLGRQGIPVSDDPSEPEIERRLKQFECEVARLRDRGP